MEFHDILHGLIEFPDFDESTKLLRDLLNSTEINRLRNMRQMNFDVPLIQELGRSRRLPHSIGVANLAFKLSKKSLLDDRNSKVLLAAAIMHDAAIPPYGHLVESELKATSSFSHERRVEELVRGKEGDFGNTEIFEGKAPEVLKILEKHQTNVDHVMSLIRPSDGTKTPISADIDLDNIDNVHRMAAMLGWDNARENFNRLVNSITLNELQEMRFSNDALPHVRKWLEFREHIYTMIIAHKECIPYNALQADLVRLAIQKEIISPENWMLNEQEFEEKLRREPSIRPLAMQLITGCEYSLVDYIWFKDFKSNKKLNNLEIVKSLTENLPEYKNDDYGYFVWNEKGLISREIKLMKTNGEECTLGYNSTSCMIAYVKKTGRNPQWPNGTNKVHWREAVISHFRDLFDVSYFRTDFPETYSGSFLTSGNNEFVFD
ncbi:HD domain-containing protein [Acinetobacter sp. NS-4]|uniref:HD domain-containing protein n=1 Tax=Acinetobacter sp. NS-4 TaxID=3127956 RepID=UPI00307F8938